MGKSEDKNQVWFLTFWLLWSAANFSGRGRGSLLSYSLTVTTEYLQRPITEETPINVEKNELPINYRSNLLS